MHEHAAALTALLATPVVVVGALAVLDAAARRGVAGAARLVAAFTATPPALKLAALLLAASAAVHLGLVPAHAADEPVTALLFTADAIALAAAAAALVAAPVSGRPVVVAAAAALLVAGLLAYAGYLLAGLETADAIGVGTQLFELAALGLLFTPSFPWRSLSA